MSADKLDEYMHERMLLETGLLEPGQPTRLAHEQHTARMSAPFRPLERRLIRDMLGLAATK